MADALTTLEEVDGAAVLTLDRPDKRNALSRALRVEIVARLDVLAKSETVRAVVLTGALPEGVPETAKRGFVAVQPPLFES